MEVTYVDVEKRAHVTLPFACEHCGHEGTAVLSFEARGGGTEGATREDAAHVAERRADRIAEKNLARQRNIIPCPSCDRIGSEGLRRWRTNRATFAAILLGIAAIGAVLTQTDDVLLSRLGWFLAILGGFVALQPAYQVIKPPAVDVRFEGQPTS